MNTGVSADGIAASPRLFPFAIDPDRNALQVVALSEADYQSESFLDSRLQIDGRNVWLDWDAVQAAMAGTRPNCHFIFHIGHVGSTLISRLLGDHPRLFSLREPEVLRGLARSASLKSRPPLPELEDGLLRLLSRTWRKNQTAVVKATSFVGEIAVDLMSRSKTARAIVMFTNPLAYLRTALGGPATRVELREAAGERLDRLQQRMGERPWRLESLSEGEAIAMSWLTETACLAAVAATFPQRTFWLNFDTFLQDPQNGLAEVLLGLGVVPEADHVSRAINGPIMRRYSKGPDHPYDADLRRRVLQQAEQDHGAEIRKGMLWLGDAATHHPFARRVLETAAQRRALVGPL